MFSVVFCFFGGIGRRLKIFFCLYFILLSNVCLAVGVASTNYVEGAIQTRVGISESTNQTLAGTYNVSGTMTVPTPPLPALE